MLIGSRASVLVDDTATDNAQRRSGNFLLKPAGSNQLAIYRRHPVDPAVFVDFWAARYRDHREHLYIENIGDPLTPQKLRKLFLWKAGGAYRGGWRQERSVETNFIERIDELKRLDKTISAKEFLTRFKIGGPIWRIFFLHCWQPDRFPIFDMHVWRARCYFERGESDELGTYSDNKKVSLYLSDYLSWVNIFDGIDGRMMDRAMWSCGKFLKAWAL
ncbi:MAG: hypothetical protein R3C45_01865 [Phycisphaerales bacterium]